MPNNLKLILDNPEIKAQFDLAVKKYPGDKPGEPSVREWLGWLLKKIMSNKPRLEEIDLQALRWTLVRLWRRELKDNQELFAAGNAIYIEEWKKYDRLAQKRPGKRDPQPMSDILARLTRG